MTALEKHLLREYKKNGILVVKTISRGAYDIGVLISNGEYEWFNASNWTESGEWIVKFGKYEDDHGLEDKYYAHFDSLKEAEFMLVQNR